MKTNIGNVRNIKNKGKMRPANPKILFLISKLKTGGAESNFVNQINYLTKAGYDIYLGIACQTDLSLNPFYKKINLPEEKKITFGFKHIYDFNKYLALNKFLQKENIKIIYSTLEDANIIARLVKIVNWKIKVFIREANDARVKTFKNKILDIILNFFTAKIIAVSRGVKNSLLKYQPMHKNKITVLENGVVMPKIDPEEVYAGKSQEEIIILTVGNLNKQKNQLYLLEIFNEIVNAGNLKLKLKLIIVGEGGLRERLERFIIDKRLEGKIILAGQIDQDKLRAYYLKAHIFVLTSLWEGCPNVILEAMAYGLPVVSTRVSGAEDIIIDKQSGFLVEMSEKEIFKEKVIQLVGDEESRERIGRVAYRRVKENYTIDKNVKELINIF